MFTNSDSSVAGDIFVDKIGIKVKVEHKYIFVLVKGNVKYVILKNAEGGGVNKFFH